MACPITSYGALLLVVPFANNEVDRLSFTILNLLSGYERLGLDWHFYFHTEDLEVIYTTSFIIFLLFINSAFGMILTHSCVLHLLRMEGELKPFKLGGCTLISSPRKLVKLLNHIIK